MEQRFAGELQAAGVDYAAAMQHFGGDEELYVEYLYRFCEDENYDRVMLYLQKGKFEDAAPALATLKKVAGSLGFAALRDECAALEEAMQAEKGVGKQADALQSVFGQTLALVLRLLQQYPAERGSAE